MKLANTFCILHLPLPGRLACYLSCFCALAVIFSSCEDQTAWTPMNNTFQGLVVNALVTDSVNYQTITLSRPVTSPSDPVLPATGAQVQVSESDGVHLYKEDSLHLGVYNSVVPYAGKVGSEYTFMATWNGIVYTAKSTMQACTGDFNKASYQWDVSRNLYKLGTICPPYVSESPAMYILHLDWSQVAGYEQMPDSLTQAVAMGYSFTSIDVSEILPPQSAGVWFPAGTSASLTKYSLDANYMLFLRGMLLETAWQGGLFNVTRANVPTNISNGGLGYFAACAIRSRQWQVGANQ